MKKYIVFFIMIGLILGTVLTFNVINVQKSKRMEFAESGYILNGSSDRYYFYEKEKYTTSYDKQIVFNDTEGTKVTLGNDNFIHYTSGNIISLQDGVLLDLSKINDDPIVYYNVASNKEIKKVSNRYTVQNLKEDVNFEEAIWKISATKYLILANNMKVTLNNGNTKDVTGYLEVEYSDSEVVNIYNQEFSYQTISSDSFIELSSGVKLNLGTKIVSVNDENKMSLEDMVINSNDNVTLIDLNENKNTNTNTEENTEIDNTTGGNGGSTTITNTTNNNNSGTTIINGGNGGTNGGSNAGTTTDTNIENDETKVNLEIVNIIYQYIQNNETKVDETVSKTEPKFKLEDMDISSVGIKATVQITDDEDLLSKNDNVTIKITNNATGKVVYMDEEAYGTFSIPIDVQTLLPDTSYSIVATATYTLNDNVYTKNFLYKTFVTSSIGVEISKEVYTANSLTFNLEFKDSNVDSAEIYLLDANGNEIINQNQTKKNSGGIEEVEFTGLEANTNYIVKVKNISYNGAVQEGENWAIYYNCQTLKEKASIDKLNYAVNKRDGTFTLYIDEVTDKDSAIKSYEYYVYEFKTILNDDGLYETTYDVKNPVYQKQTTDRNIVIDVGNEQSNDSIIRGKSYGFKVIATTYDNEKYVDVESTIAGAFSLNGKTFPTVKFTKATNNDFETTEIIGYLDIIDNQNTIVVDDQNPLTISYYSDVVENTTYLKITNLDAYGDGKLYGKTEDVDGNSVIRINVDLGKEGNKKDGLKAQTSYTFSAYGTVDLQDEESTSGGYKNAYIGSSIITTDKYSPITANLSVPENAPAGNAFTVDLSFDADTISSEESLSSVDIMVYEGSGDINSGEYNSWSRTITNNNFDQVVDNAKYPTEVASLQDLFFENSLVVTPSLIGGGYESSYTEANYQVVVTATVDGTQYTNKIPVKSADDDDINTGDTTYTNKSTKETYTAAYIIVKGKGTTADITEDTARPTATVITNAEANRYGLEKDSNLLDNTAVGYFVSTKFANTGSLSAKSVTYYVWDAEGNPIYEKDESGKYVTDDNGNRVQLKQTLNFVTQDKAPSAIFELDYGTIDTIEKDNETGKLHRGDGYIFSYTVTYTDNNGNDIIWPLNITEDDGSSKYTTQTLKTEILYPQKQDPSFVMYPITSDDTTVTYKYSCKDVDAALQYNENDTREYAHLILAINGSIQNSDIQVKTDGKLDNLSIYIPQKNVTFTLSYNKNVNKAKNGKVYETVTMVTQKFEGIVNCNDVSIESIAYDNDKSPNSIRLKLSGDKASRIAAAQVKFTQNGETMTSKLLKVNDDDNYYFDVDLLELAATNSNFDSFIGKQSNIEVILYYDDGVIGYAPTNAFEYSAYTNANGAYVALNDANFEVVDKIGGNMYNYSFTAENSEARLGISNIDAINNGTAGVTLSMQYTESGLKQNDMIITQKEIAKTEFATGKTISIQSLRAGIKMNKIETSIKKAEISASLIKPNSMTIPGGITIEIYHTKDKDAKPNWKSDTVITKLLQENEFENTIVLDDLSPAEYYYIRFRYNDGVNDVYLYDMDTKEVGAVYQFETLATIGINSISIKYDAVKYKEKYIDIDYKITQNRSNMYEFTKYAFYEADGTTLVPLTDNNVVTGANSKYEINENGELIVTNANYETENLINAINEKISISPDYNTFSINKKYILKITPMVTYNGALVEIETEEAEFTLDTLQEPKIGLTMRRQKVNQNNNEIDYIRVTTTVQDPDAMIQGQEYGEYELHVYRYKGSSPEFTEENEVPIYSTPIGGSAMTEKKFNINDYGTNFSVYVQQSSIDYRTYSYIAVIKLKYDRNNDGNTEDKEEKYSISKIENDQDVAIGSTALVQNENSCEMRFYDSYYNITKIDKITYTMYNLTNSQTQSGTFTPVWRQEEDSENPGVSYYKVILPETFKSSGTYTIQMNLFVGNTLVGTINNTAYINKNN